LRHQPSLLYGSFVPDFGLLLAGIARPQAGETFRQGPADPPRHPALMGLSLEHLFKFGLAAVMTVPLCFAAAYLVLKILFASMVL